MQITYAARTYTRHSETGTSDVPAPKHEAVFALQHDCCLCSASAGSGSVTFKSVFQVGQVKSVKSSREPLSDWSSQRGVTAPYLDSNGNIWRLLVTADLV